MYSCDQKTCALQIVHSKYVLFNQNSTMAKYFAGTARSFKLNSKGIPRNLLIWWLCRNGPLFTRFVCPWRAAMPCVCDSHAGGHGTGHVLSWPPKPCIQEPPFAFFAPSTPLRVTFGQKAQIVQPHLKKKKHFKMLCQFPASPQKQNVLFSYSLHALLFSAGTQTNDCGFQLCVDCFVNTFNRMS